MKNNFVSFIAFFMMFFLSFEILFSGKLPKGLGIHRAGNAEIGKFAYVVGFGLLCFSLYLFYRLIYKNSRKPSTTKCPKCKEVFEYKDTLEGKCPHCKDVDTIELKEYYKKYPDEKKL